jgi:hypothetical protein
MPGTDMCLKIGGWVRSEVTTGINGSSTTGIFNNDLNNRTTSNLWTRERGYITADAREQTAYGVARGYIDVGISTNNNGLEVPGSSDFSSNRAFVQWAGFTAGLSVSFFDFYPAAAYLYRAGNIPNEDTGDGGLWVWGYTAQLGGGFSATLSAEERRMTQIIGLTAGGAALIGTTSGFLPGTAFSVPTSAAASAGAYGGWQSPDIVGNLRADQAWGSAQVMGALHQLNPLYYSPGTDSTVTSGHAPDSWGWVVGGGIKINTPFVSPGDNFITEVNYTQGALKYLWNASGVNQGAVNGGSAGYGVSADCVYAGTANVGTSCLKTSAWEIDAAYEHYWTPQWHQSLVGAYEAVSYGSSANGLLCTVEGQGAGGGTALAGCNNNWSFWGVGSRLQWDVTKSFYIGVEALYENLNTAKSATGLLPAGMAFSGSCNSAGVGSCTVSNQSNWTFTVRMHKDFLP